MNKQAVKHKRAKPKPSGYTYVMHVTETVESQVEIKSKRKLTYAELEDKAEKARVSGELTFCGVSDVSSFLEESKPGGSDALRH